MTCLPRAQHAAVGGEELPARVAQQHLVGAGQLWGSGAAAGWGLWFGLAACIRALRIRPRDAGNITCREDEIGQRGRTKINKQPPQKFGPTDLPTALICLVQYPAYHKEAVGRGDTGSGALHPQLCTSRGSGRP